MNEEIDWQMVALRIRQHMPLTTASNRLSICRRHLQRLARGEVNEPGYNSGVRLLRFVEELEGER